jgi:hypothetical protein
MTVAAPEQDVAQWGDMLRAMMGQVGGVGMDQGV